MKLEIPVKVYFDDVQGMIDEVKKLQTYKLFEGDDMVLVDLDAVVAIMANHVKADKCSETPNGWIPVSKETNPSTSGWYIVTCPEEMTASNERFSSIAEYNAVTGEWFDMDEPTDCYLVWMPLPEPYRPEEE